MEKPLARIRSMIYGWILLIPKTMAERNGGWTIGSDSISLIGDSTREDQDQATAERGRVYRDKFLIRKGLYILRVMYRP